MRPSNRTENNQPARRVLVIGGAGFIGSHVVDAGLRLNWQVWVYDNFSTGRRDFLPNDPALCVIEGDILDTASLKRALTESQAETVLHLAAIHHIPTCEKMPEQALRVNIEGLQSVFSACAQNPVARVVFTSTGALYDPQLTGPLSETSHTQAHDIYSISKLTGEHLLKYFTARTGIPGVVARLFNTVGRRETNAHLIPAIMGQLSAGSRSIRLGNLHPRRDYIHVEDVAEALVTLAARTAETPFEVFNVGSGQETSVRELVTLCGEVIGEPVEAVSAPELQRKVDRPSQLADLTKIQQATSWKPTRSLRQALGEIWEECRANPAAQ